MIHGLSIKIKLKRLIREEKIINGNRSGITGKQQFFIIIIYFIPLAPCSNLNLTITNGILQ
jgi:hypothetical protein